MFDVRQLQRLMKLDGLSPEQVSRRAGLDRHTVPRILKGRHGAKSLKYETVIKIARSFDIPVTDLDDDHDSQHPWHVFHWLETTKVNRYLERIARSKSCLECTRGLNSYLQPTPMLEWGFATPQKLLGWTDKQISDAFQSIKSYANKQRHERQHRDFVHRVLCQERFFLEAFIQEPAWLDTVSEALKHEYGGDTALGLLSPSAWLDLEAFLATDLARYGFPSWDKICVADEILAMVRPTPDYYMVTCHQATVQTLLRKLHQATKFVPYTFSLHDDSTLTTTVKQTILRLKEIAKNAELERKKSPPGDLRAQANRRLWIKLALRTQLVGEKRAD